MGLLRLVGGQVQLGQALPFSVRDEHGKLLLAQGQVIENAAQLEQLLQRGSTVDEAEVEQARRQQAAAAADSTRRLTLFDLWGRAVNRLERLQTGLGTEQGTPERWAAFASDFVALVERDTDIAIYLSVRQDPQRMRLYGLTHALHCALVACLMAPPLGWSATRRQSVLLAALTMNLSIVELQGFLATHGGKLTDKQREAVRQHPQQAGDALRAAGVTDPDWLQAVEQHHEVEDGSGYPAGLRTPSESAVALRLADVFMAKISPRVERPGLPIQEAARQMFQGSGGSPLAAAVVKAFGLYPPGDFVRLASGELAVVIRRGEDARSPLVASITDRSGIPIVNTIQRDTRQAAYAITGPVLDPKLALRVPPERLFGLGH